MSAGQAGSVDEFRQAVAAAFGSGWRVEATSQGFRAAQPLRDAPDGADELVMDVVVDAAARTFTQTTRRLAAERFDRSASGWTATGFRASREVRSSNYSGIRRTAVFRRTPHGLVPDPAASADSAGREADLARVAAELGWTDVTPAGGVGGAGLAGLAPKKVVVIVVLVFVVVIVAIVGVGIALGATVLGMLGR